MRRVWFFCWGVTLFGVWGCIDSHIHGDEVESRSFEVRGYANQPGETVRLYTAVVSNPNPDNPAHWMMHPEVTAAGSGLTWYGLQWYAFSSHLTVPDAHWFPAGDSGRRAFLRGDVVNSDSYLRVFKEPMTPFVSPCRNDPNQHITDVNPCLHDEKFIALYYACGGSGQPCCSFGASCNSTAPACYSGTCQPCGQEDEICCPTGDPCPGSGLQCDTFEGTCRQPCQPGASCQADAQGECANGTMQCTSAFEGHCVAGQPSPETCNGLDDNCDGIVDNIPPDPCQGTPAECSARQGFVTTGVTVCSGGQQQCQFTALPDPGGTYCNGSVDPTGQCGLGTVDVCMQASPPIGPHNCAPNRWCSGAGNTVFCSWNPNCDYTHVPCWLPSEVGAQVCLNPNSFP
jgi:hypothetical protein